MTIFQVVGLLVLVIATAAQSNVCYANCKKGYCSPNNPLGCTQCDQGLLNINNQCATTNIQPNPLTYLTPNPSNTLLDYSDISLASCNIIPQGSNVLTKMLFRTVIGNSFTQQFSIPSDHSYLRIKFNSMLLSSNTYTQVLSLLINIVPTSNLRTFLLSKTSTINPNTLTMNCNTSISNINHYYGVFFLDFQLPSNERNIIVQIIPQGLINTYVASTDFQIYFGNCHQSCATCTGPTSTQCNTCSGLLTTLSAGTCTTCPAAFYQNTICRPCPPTCQACTFQSNAIVCTQCRALPNINFTLSQGSCSSTQLTIQTLTDKNFSTIGWKSSEVISNPLSFCGQYKLLGGISIGIANSYFTYTINNLPSHSNLYLVYSLLLIDQNPGDTYQYTLKLDSLVRQQSFAIPSQGMTNQCGSSQPEYLRKESLSFVHNSSSANIVINVLISYLGIRDFLVVVDNPTADPNCLTFSNGVCLSCRNGLVVNNSKCQSCLNGYYLTNTKSNLNCQPCPLTCSSCNYNSIKNTVLCTSCREPLTLDENYCIDTSHSLYDAEIIPNTKLENQKITLTYYPPLQHKGISSCNSSQMLGTNTIQSKFLNMYKTFTNLPTHKGVILYFTLFQIDDNYFNDNSLTFKLDSKNFTQADIPNFSILNQLSMNLCGNTSLDKKFIVELKDANHGDNSLSFSLQLSRMGKIGINNMQLYLLNTQKNNQAPFELQISPAYSVNTPATKGLQVKLIFPQQFQSITSVDSAFIFTIQSTTNQGRLLQQGYSNEIIAQNATYNDQQINYLLNLTQDYNSENQLKVRAAQQNSIYFQNANGQNQLISQQAVTTPITRYIDVDNNDSTDRSSQRNLYNLFRGCAILGMFIGMASFLFGMSSAFDDFFLLCQVIFVHVFIQLPYNPPSLRIPFNGLSIVQFLQWLPLQAKLQIEKGIIPDTLYQPTSLIFQQYFQDVAFVRMIYQTILYFALILSLWLLMHVILLIYDSEHPNQKTKYENFFIYYYKQYNSKSFVFVDKIVRFAYFTIAWACFLQFISFKNQPQSFHIWNSILNIVLFIAIVLYPIIMFLILRSNANSLSDTTFNNAYEQIRIDKEKLYYYLVRYYKFFLIALIIAVTYNSSPVIPLVLLIIINLIDVILLIALKPLGMVQAEVINAYLFYPYYPRVYHITAIVQNCLFIVMEVFFLILVGIRNSGSSSAYMGVGYVICAFVILLLLNGLLRLVWGAFRFFEYCYLEREANYMSVEKQMQQNDQNQQQPILPTDIRTQQQLSRRDLTSKLFTNKKKSYVSKIR